MRGCRLLASPPDKRRAGPVTARPQPTPPSRRPSLGSYWIPVQSRERMWLIHRVRAGYSYVDICILIRSVCACNHMRRDAKKFLPTCLATSSTCRWWRSAWPCVTSTLLCPIVQHVRAEDFLRSRSDGDGPVSAPVLRVVELGPVHPTVAVAIHVQGRMAQTSSGRPSGIAAVPSSFE